MIYLHKVYIQNSVDCSVTRRHSSKASHNRNYSLKCVTILSNDHQKTYIAHWLQLLKGSFTVLCRDTTLWAKSSKEKWHYRDLCLPLPHEHWDASRSQGKLSIHSSHIEARGGGWTHTMGCDRPAVSGGIAQDILPTHLPEEVCIICIHSLPLACLHMT